MQHDFRDSRVTARRVNCGPARGQATGGKVTRPMGGSTACYETHTLHVSFQTAIDVRLVDTISLPCSYHHIVTLNLDLPLGRNTVHVNLLNNFRGSMRRATKSGRVQRLHTAAPDMEAMRDCLRCSSTDLCRSWMALIVARRLFILIRRLALVSRPPAEHETDGTISDPLCSQHGEHAQTRCQSRRSAC